MATQKCNFTFSSSLKLCREQLLTMWFFTTVLSSRINTLMHLSCQKIRRNTARASNNWKIDRCIFQIGHFVCISLSFICMSCTWFTFSRFPADILLRAVDWQVWDVQTFPLSTKQSWLSKIARFPLQSSMVVQLPYWFLQILAGVTVTEQAGAILLSQVPVCVYVATFSHSHYLKHWHLQYQWHKLCLFDTVRMDLSQTSPFLMLNPDISYRMNLSGSGSRWVLFRSRKHLASCLCKEQGCLRILLSCSILSLPLKLYPSLCVLGIWCRGLANRRRLLHYGGIQKSN